jgi:hypothetical protein
MLLGPLTLDAFVLKKMPAFSGEIGQFRASDSDFAGGYVVQTTFCQISGSRTCECRNQTFANVRHTVADKADVSLWQR